MLTMPVDFLCLKERKKVEDRPMKETLSVLMCVRNGGRSLQDSVRSILEQTHSDFEFIIVENGSTDDTWELLHSIDDSRISLFQTEIKQLSYNLNFALDKAKFCWIARMDADDISHPQRLEKQLEFLEDHNKVKVLGTQTRLFCEGRFIGNETVPTANQAIRNWMPFKSVLLHPTIVFNRQTILEAGGYLGGRLGQDFDLWLRLSRDPEIQFANLSDAYLDYHISPSQGRRSKESYASSVGYLMREFMMTYKPSYLAGAATFALKGIIRGK